MSTLLNPTLLVEVLSPSTEGADRGKKFEHYRAIPSLREVMFVAQHQPLVEHYLRQADGRWLLTTVAGLDGTVELPTLEVSLPLSDDLRAGAGANRLLSGTKCAARERTIC